jgi:hypothetical protein
MNARQFVAHNVFPSHGHYSPDDVERLIHRAWQASADESAAVALPLLDDIAGKVELMNDTIIWLTDRLPTGPDGEILARCPRCQAYHPATLTCGRRK